MISKLLGPGIAEDLVSLLSVENRRIIKTVCLELERQFSPTSLLFSKDKEDSSSSPVVIDDNLKTFIQELKQDWRHPTSFNKKFQSWKKARKQSIETLEKIGNSLNSNRKICNFTRLVGNCTSFVGGGMLVASAAMILSPPTAVVGGIATVLGSATSIGSSATELALLKKNIEKAKIVLKKDKEAFKPLESIMSSNLKVAEAFKDILSIDPTEKLTRVWSSLKNFLIDINKNGDLSKLYRFIEKLMHTLELELESVLTMEVMPRVIALLLTVTVLLTESGFSEDKPWEEQLNQFSSATRNSLNTIGSLFSIAKGSTIVEQYTAQALAKGTVGMVCMTLDAISITLTTTDIMKGSLSQEGEKVKELVRMMKEEESMLDLAFVSSIAEIVRPAFLSASYQNPCHSTYGPTYSAPHLTRFQI